jgi:hypothetical protein
MRTLRPRGPFAFLLVLAIPSISAAQPTLLYPRRNALEVAAGADLRIADVRLVQLVSDTGEVSEAELVPDPPNDLPGLYLTPQGERFRPTTPVAVGHEYRVLVRAVDETWGSPGGDLVELATFQVATEPDVQAPQGVEIETGLRLVRAPDFCDDCSTLNLEVSPLAEGDVQEGEPVTYQIDLAETAEELDGMPDFDLGWSPVLGALNVDWDAPPPGFSTTATAASVRVIDWARNVSPWSAPVNLEIEIEPPVPEDCNLTWMCAGQGCSSVSAAPPPSRSTAWFAGGGVLLLCFAVRRRLPRMKDTRASTTREGAGRRLACSTVLPRRQVSPGKT